MANEKHLLVVAAGTYVASELQIEEWQCTLRYYAAPGGTPDPIGTFSNAWDPVATTISRVETDWNIDGNWRVEGGVNDLAVDDWLNDQLAPAWRAWMNAACRSSAATLNTIKVYPIGATSGHVIPAPPYSTGSPVTLTWTDNAPQGGASTPLLPLQNSAVLSHRTAQTGRRGRGRMFSPAVTGTMLDTTHARLSSTAIGDLRDAQVDLLQDTQLTVPGAGFWCLPVVTGAPWTQYALITQVQVGNYVDTQRRRRNQLTETYTSASVDNPA